MANYSEPYVKFFLHRNSIVTYTDFERVAPETFSDPRIAAIIAELAGWPCREITNHKDVDHPLHKLGFIAELGMNRNDPGIGRIVGKILENQSEEGPFQLLIRIPERYGGTGRPAMSWILSDAPLLIYSTIRLNSGEITPEIRKGMDHIAGLVSDNGWRCTASPDLGGFRGPGKKSDPCPYATMWSLKMLSTTQKGEYHRAKEIGIKTLLELWSRREETRPYLFAMGTDFRKLKLPFVWYDILNVVDTLSRYEESHDAPGFLDMLKIIREKRTDDGYTPESMYLKSKLWDFGQKKIPSQFLTAVVQGIEKRVNISRR